MSEVEGDVSPSFVAFDTLQYAVFLIIAFLSYFLSRKTKSWINLVLVILNGWIAAYLLFSTLVLFVF